MPVSGLGKSNGNEVRIEKPEKLTFGPVRVSLQLIPKGVVELGRSFRFSRTEASGLSLYIPIQSQTLAVGWIILFRKCNLG